MAIGNVGGHWWTKIERLKCVRFQCVFWNLNFSFFFSFFLVLLECIEITVFEDPSFVRAQGARAYLDRYLLSTLFLC